MEQTNPYPMDPNPVNQNRSKKLIVVTFALVAIVIIGIYAFFIVSKQPVDTQKPAETSSEKTTSSEIPITINGYFLAPEIPQKSVVSLMKYDAVFGPDGKMQPTPFGYDKLVAFDPKNGSTTEIFGIDLDIENINFLSPKNRIEFHGFFRDRKRLIFEQNLPFKDCFGEEGRKNDESILWIADLEQQTFYPLFNERQGFSFDIMSLSPDGKTIIGSGAIACPQRQLTLQERFRGIFLFDIENNQMRKIQISDNLDATVSRIPPSFILWTPDNSSIVFNVNLDVYRFYLTTNQIENLFQLQKKTSSMSGSGRVLDDGRIIYIDKKDDCEFGLGFFTYTPNEEIKSICPPYDILQSSSIGIDPSGTFATYGVPHRDFHRRATVIQNLETGEVNVFDKSIGNAGAFGSWWAE